VTDVVATTRIAAAPEIVFPYFTDPALITTWLAKTAELAPDPGGVFSIDVDGNAVVGTFVAIEPPTRVVFTWGMPGSTTMPPGSTTVEVVLTPEGDGTLVALTHRDLPPTEEPPHREGWAHFLGKLAARPW
jgi:uncharacterized protein YndB with AHSA1/START domain